MFLRFRHAGSEEERIYFLATQRALDSLQTNTYLRRAGGKLVTPTSLPGIRMPDGLLFKFVDEIFDLIKKGKATAAEKYLFLYEDADGEFGEYMDDQLPKLFLGYPQEVLTLWPIFQKHRKRLAMLQGFTTERERKRIAAKYEGLCKPGDNRCAEVRKVFVPR